MAEAQMKLRDSISESTKDAMRRKDALRVSTLRLVSAAIKDRDIAARKALSETEMKTAIAAIVEETGATCLKDMGKIMGRLKTDFAGRLDMGKAGAIVKDHLCD